MYKYILYCIVFIVYMLYYLDCLPYVHVFRSMLPSCVCVQIGLLNYNLTSAALEVCSTFQDDTAWHSYFTGIFQSTFLGKTSTMALSIYNTEHAQCTCMSLAVIVSLIFSHLQCPASFTVRKQLTPFIRCIL